MPQGMGEKQAMNEKPVNEMSKEEVLQWLKCRREEPLYVESDEQEGMSLCYVNPAIVQDGEEKQDDPNAKVEKTSEKLPTPAKSVARSQK